MNGLPLFATVTPGIEDLAAEEVKKLLGCKATPDVGKIFFECRVEDIYKLNLCTRTLNRIFLNLYVGKFKDLNDIYRLTEGIDYSFVIERWQKFAVRSERAGIHNFTSMDVSSVVGKAIIDSFQKTANSRLKVDLDNPDVEFYALVRNDDFILGINLTGRSLHRRGYRVYNHPAALKPTLASAMLQLSGWRLEESIIDPMCGGGTIPIEAAYMAGNIAPNRFRTDFAFLKIKLFNEEDFEKAREKVIFSERSVNAEIYGMEKYQHHLEGCIRNAEKAGVHEDVQFKLGDATKSSDYPISDLDYVVVNPPYGLRMTPKISISRLYREFLETLKDVAEGSLLVIITAASKRFRSVSEESDIAILEERRIMHGDLNVKIFKCRI